jgi:hypothetical protein
MSQTSYRTALRCAASSVAPFIALGSWRFSPRMSHSGEGYRFQQKDVMPVVFTYLGFTLSENSLYPMIQTG